MRRRYLIHALLAGLLLLAGCARTARAPVQESAQRPAVTVAGEWKEHWGSPGQTDVTYHDLYRVAGANDGSIKVQILGRDQTIYDEHLEGMVLTFTQHTDTYVVHYALTLQQDGQWMAGTATTPKSVVNIRWERTK